MGIAITSQSARYARQKIDQPTSQIFTGRPIEFAAVDEIVCLEQTPAIHFYQIVRGCVRIYKMTESGRRAIISFRFKNDFFGRFLDHPTYLYTAEAVTDLELRRISHIELRERLARQPERGAELMHWAAQTMIDAQDHIVALGSRTALEGVAHFLVTVARKHFQTDAAHDLELPINRTDIADFLGLTIESVSRALTRLKNEGLITTRGNRRLKLKDLSALIARAGLPTEEGTPTPLTRHEKAHRVTAA